MLNDDLERSFHRTNGNTIFVEIVSSTNNEKEKDKEEEEGEVEENRDGENL